MNEILLSMNRKIQLFKLILVHLLHLLHLYTKLKLV